MPQDGRVSLLETHDDSRHHHLVVEPLRQREREELIDRMAFFAELEVAKTADRIGYVFVTASSKHADMPGSHRGDERMGEEHSTTLDAHLDACSCLPGLESVDRQWAAFDSDLSFGWRLKERPDLY